MTKVPGPSAKSSATVTVCSKLPMSMWIHVDHETTRRVPGRYGSEPETIFNPGKQYWIRGTAEPAGQAPKGYKRPEIVEGGFAMTHGIPADFWEEWKKQHAETDMVKNGLIFAHANRDYVEGHSEEHAKLQSGFQALDPDALDKDPRMPRPVNITEISEVQPGTRDAA